MQGYNAIVVLSENAEKMLMCIRSKNPYQGLSNFVGGKIEENETGMDAAYRELEEETGITQKDIVLSHLMDFSYPLEDIYLEIYVGRCNKAVAVHGEENDLYWSSLDQDFFDVTRYAGEGNIGHIMLHVKMHPELWK